MILGSKIKNYLKLPSVHLEPISGKCKQCKICDQNCPMSLEVSKMVQNSSMENAECILCGVCVDNCPQGIIKYVQRYEK